MRLPEDHLAPMPIHIRDQAHAANAETQTLIDEADIWSTFHTATTPQQIVPNGAEAAARSIRYLAATIGLPEPTWCEHLDAEPHQPAVYAPRYDTEMVQCLDCYTATQANPFVSEDTDITCDLCRHYTDTLFDIAVLSSIAHPRGAIPTILIATIDERCVWGLHGEDPTHKINRSGENQQ